MVFYRLLDLNLLEDHQFQIPAKSQHLNHIIPPFSPVGAITGFGSSTKLIVFF